MGGSESGCGLLVGLILDEGFTLALEYLALGQGTIWREEGSHAVLGAVIAETLHEELLLAVVRVHWIKSSLGWLGVLGLAVLSALLLRLFGFLVIAGVGARA